MSKKKGSKKRSIGSFLKTVFFWFLFLAFFGIIGWVLFFSDYTELQKVEIITDKLDKTQLEEISDKYRGELWYKYFSKNNFFFFPRKNFSSLVKGRFKNIRKISFENKFPTTIIIKIEERQGLMIWCSRDKCFLMDETGLVFYQLQRNEKEEHFGEYGILIDKSNLEVEVGQKIEEGTLVNFVLKTKELLKSEIGLEIKREVETSSLISKEVRIKTKDGWQIYFNLENKPSLQIELLKELLNSSISQSEREKLNYIDLRITGRAIYNSSFSLEKNEEKEELKEE